MNLFKISQDAVIPTPNNLPSPAIPNYSLIATSHMYPIANISLRLWTSWMVEHILNCIIQNFERYKTYFHFNFSFQNIQTAYLYSTRSYSTYSFDIHVYVADMHLAYISNLQVCPCNNGFVIAHEFIAKEHTCIRHCE